LSIAPPPPAPLPLFTLLVYTAPGIGISFVSNVAMLALQGRTFDE